MNRVAKNYGPGKVLQEAREDKNISLREIADRLKLSETVVNAIEENDIESLPAPAFVRGYIRSYALLVDLDPDSVVGQFHSVSPSDPELVNISPAKSQKQGMDPVMLWATAAIALTLLVLFILWAGNWYKGYLKESKVASGQAQERMTMPYVSSAHTGRATADDEPSGSRVEALDDFTAEESADLTEPSDALSLHTGDVLAMQVSDELLEQDSSAAEEDVLINEILEDKPQSSSDSGKLAKTESELEVDPTAPAGSDIIKLQARGQSWVYITDANGHRLIYRIVNQDESPILQGQAPFDVVLGASPNILISLNGQSFDHTLFTRANLSARFILRAQN